MKYFSKTLFSVILSIAVLTFVACETDDTQAPPQQEQPDEPNTPNEPEEPENPDTPKDPEEPKDPEKPDEPVLPANYVMYGEEVVELKSACYHLFDLDNLGYQYYISLSPAEGLDHYMEFVEAEEHAFLSLGEEVLAGAIENSEGVVDVMAIAEDDMIYSFVANIGNLSIEDYSFDHAMITAGRVTVALDEVSYAMTLRAEYTTAEGVAVTIVASVPYVEAELPEDVKPDTESAITYTWSGKTVEKPLESAYVEETAEGVIYTLCVDVVKTYVVYEDSIFLRFFVADKGANDSFDMNLATTTEEFSLRLCDPIKGLDYKAETTSRDGLTGVLKVDRGIVSVELAAQDVEATATFGGEYRSVNECIDVVDNGRELLFTPASVLLDNSDAETFKVYVSSKAGVTTVNGMADAEVVITYPASRWSTLTSGNFVAGSGMTFTIGGVTYVKGEGDAVGMNCQFISYDAASGRLTLNANLYTKQGGVAIYYVGGYVLVE